MMKAKKTITMLLLITMLLSLLPLYVFADDELGVGGTNYEPATIEVPVIPEPPEGTPPV